MSSRVHGSCPWLSMAQVARGQKAIRKFNIGGVRKKKISRQRRRKSGGGASEPSPGGRFPRSPLAEVGHRRSFFRRHVIVLLCGWDVAAPRGRLRPSGARESPLFGGRVLTKIFSKIQNVTTTLAYYILRISLNPTQSSTLPPPQNLAWSRLACMLAGACCTRDACHPRRARRHLPIFFFFFFILRRMGKNKAQAHHTSMYFHTRRVSI